ncbi:MAG TPA: 50S ribosomal protein L16 [Candidatus Lokiarchaeia archaeon]|nr:50S ribosomal protein L16 [Candidatus Lokiarchaeia archaeon]
MGHRPWRCYSGKIRCKPYIKKRAARGKDLIHGGQDPKIRMFDMGDLKGNIDFDVTLGVQILHTVLCSDGTLEATRTSCNRALRENVGKNGFLFKVRPHPYRVFRENKLMGFAGADRISCGMRQSFGKPMGRCALLKAGQIVLECSSFIKWEPQVKRALKVASYKFPRACRLVILHAKDEKIKKQIGLPSPDEA